jgi:hypothetical protein
MSNLTESDSKIIEKDYKNEYDANNIFLIKLGSNTAKNGFKNEYDVIDIFNDWKNNSIAQEWLVTMNYKISEIEYVKAVKVEGHFKADVQVQIKIIIKLREEIDCQNISVKLVSNNSGFNQIDKRWVDNYRDLWNIPNDIVTTLKYFTGENLPYKQETKDKRRMFINEMEEEQQIKIVNFFEANKYLIISDILKGRGQFAAEWMLVIRKINGNFEWILKPINYAINYYLQGNTKITNKGSIKLGKITIQRKGGDGGRNTAKMLQFKFDPTELFNS